VREIALHTRRDGKDCLPNAQNFVLLSFSPPSRLCWLKELFFFCSPRLGEDNEVSAGTNATKYAFVYLEELNDLPEVGLPKTSSEIVQELHTWRKCIRRLIGRRSHDGDYRLLATQIPSVISEGH
jgi:hypothetical protein